jgi:predicted transcriptional regulator
MSQSEFVFPARRTDPETSHEAARSINITRLEKVVLDAFISHGEMTTHELAQVTSLELVTVSPRVRPLVRKGLIRDSGRRKIGESGRPSIIWTT